MYMVVVQYPKLITTFKPCYIYTKKIKYIKSVSVAPPNYIDESRLSKDRLNFDAKYRKVVQCSISINEEFQENLENEITLIVYGNIENIPDYIINNFQEALIVNSSYYEAYKGKKVFLKSILNIYNCNTATPCYTYSRVPDFKPVEVNKEYYIE